MTKDAYVYWQWVQRRMAEVGISSFRELERRAGITNGFPTVEMAEGLSRALRVSWVELWEQAGFAERLRADDLAGLDAEIYEALKGTSDEFKRAVLSTIRIWLGAREAGDSAD